jgi:hypothetical protein
MIERLTQCNSNNKNGMCHITEATVLEIIVKVNEVIDFINANNSHQIDTNVGNITSFGSINRKLHIAETHIKTQAEAIENLKSRMNISKKRNDAHMGMIEQQDAIFGNLKKELERATTILKDHSHAIVTLQETAMKNIGPAIPEPFEKINCMAKFCRDAVNEAIKAKETPTRKTCNHQMSGEQKMCPFEEFALICEAPDHITCKCAK